MTAAGDVASQGTRCTGHCCRRFYLSDRNLALVRILPERVQDGRQIAGMLIATDHSNLFDCRHLASNGDCRIYERRPRMCSRWPYGKGCGRPGCTWAVVRRVNGGA